METKEQRRRPRLRPGYEFMEPDELTPEERLDRVIELLTIMCVAAEGEAVDSSEAT